MTDQAAALFARNMELLAALAPDVARQIATVSQVEGVVVPDPTDPDDINLRIGNSLLYAAGLGAGAHARRDVADFLAHPLQLACPPLRARTGRVTDMMRTAVDEFLDRRGLATAARPQAHRGATMIVFGIGLGAQVDALLDSLEFRHLIIVEPVTEFLWHSLHVRDWTRWRDVQAARGGGLQVVSAATPEAMAARLYDHVLDNGLGLIDGAYLYQHYRTEALDACLRQFHQHIDGIQGEGFFEDELVMFVNATRNFAAGPVRLVINREVAVQPMPAIIVGAGPSLEKALPALARLRDRAVIFSAGSTLGSLLRHGITPDFQCEIENTPENYQVLQPLADTYDLSGVTLVGSATVDPRMPALFGRHLFYLRDYSMSSSVYGDAERTINGTGPNCVTMALRIAERFGFAQVFLFGADFGSRQPDRHHVADSIWMTDPAWRQLYDEVAEQMDIRVPANFGGKVYTNRLMTYFLTAAENLIRHQRNVAYVNCSDGVRIRGAVPRMAAQVVLPEPPLTPAETVADIVARTEEHAAFALIEGADVDGCRAEVAAWADGLLAELGRLHAGSADLIAWHDAIIGSISGRERAGRPMIRILAGGTVIMMFRHALHHAIRHDLLTDRGFLDVVFGILVAALNRMRDRFDAAVAAETTRAV